NSITTGGLVVDANDIYYQTGSSSNSGPTSDGRRKPELVAPSAYQQSPQASSDTSWGDNPSYTSGQTSWAVPHTGGVAAVLLSYAIDSAEPDDDQNEVIKAVIVNSAFPNIKDKSGNSTINFSGPDWPWNTDRGYGRIDAKRAYEILSTPGISTTNSKGWAFDSVASGQQDSYTIRGIKNERLAVTLTWNRRVEWNDSKSPFSQRDVIEDGELDTFFANLDLEIRDPDEILISPTASSIDNLEKVDLLLTKTGDYEIRVVNQSGSESADYALAFEVLEPLTADFNVDYVVNTDDLVEFVPYWLDSDCNNPIQPCFDYNLSINDSIDLSDFSIFAQQWLDYDNRYYSP
ncbi:MAG: S8 family serine peptidase, partial [Planctomycetota bacterium]